MKQIVILLCLTCLLNSLSHAQRIALAKNKGYHVSDEFPIHQGQVDYQAFITGSRIFCDKTLLIPKLLADEEASAIVITYPRRWGKTTNLEMIKTFLQIQLDQAGNRIPTNKTTAYKIFKVGKLVERGAATVNLDTPLLVSQYDDFIKQFLAKYPTIYLDLSGIKGNTFDEFVSFIRKEIAHVYRCHLEAYEFYKKLVNNEEAPQHERSKANMYVNRIIATTAEEEYAGVEMLKTSLAFLCEILNEFYGERPYILIDDYDLPLAHQLLYKESKPEVLEGVKFYVDFLKYTIDENPFMEKTIMSGRLPLYKNDFFSTKQTIKEYNILTRSLYEFYGFTKNELDTAFEYLGVSANLSQQFHLQNYGYRLKRNSDAKIYNPWAVSQFIWKPYVNASIWIEDEKVDVFVQNALHMLPFENALSILLTGGSYPIELFDLIFTEIDFASLNFVQHNIDGKTPSKLRDSDVALKYLFASGYLTLSDNFTNSKNPSETYLKIPNPRIHSALKELTLSHFRAKFYTNRSNADDHLKSISRYFEMYIADNVFLFDNLTKSIENYLKLLPPFGDTRTDPKRQLRGNDQTVRSLFNYLLLYTDQLQFIPHDYAFWGNESLRSDPVFRHHRYRGSLFEFRFNRKFQGEDLFQDEHRCKAAFQPFKDIYDVKLIGMNIDANKTVQICGFMYTNAKKPDPKSAVPL